MMLLLVAGEQNRWCVEGDGKYLRDAKMVNDKRENGGPIREGGGVTAGSLHLVRTFTVIHPHKCGWMAQRPRGVGEEMVREFYASYLCHSQGLHFEEVKALASGPTNFHIGRGNYGGERRDTAGWPNTFFADGGVFEWVLCSRLGIGEGDIDLCGQILTVLGAERGCRRLKRIIKSRGGGGHGSGIGSGSRD
ncbi:hypothetical protein H5410_021169 [Solanum commersonii]|uniref:Uncharacterized protein n=1 Tax=Solanum commersonii TaxID=4109 RepID=A0A9J5ZDG6_SOLCO|nr:hypothetical protein H5410_021169 [Solanum commersonii]